MNKDINTNGKTSAGAPKNGERAQPKSRRKRNKNNSNLFLIIASVLCVVVFIWFAFDKLFIISSFEIDGAREYTEAEAEKAASYIGLEKGMGMFSFNRKEALINARYYLSEFDDVSIRYRLPDKIVFKVKEAVPAMYIYEGERFYILSDGLKVISAHDNGEEAENMALKKVYIGGITQCRTGMFLKTDGGCDNILKDLIEIFKEEEIIADTDEVDVRNKFSLTFQYKKRFTVKLGSADNLTVKVRFMKSISEKLAETDSGYIDVSDEDFREGFFKAY